jgi:hypothetical protein
MESANSTKPENSIASDLLNSAKKRLGSNFWLSLLGVFIYQNYTYFLHIFYSKKELYCYDYMKHLTDYYIIKGITGYVFAGYVLRAIGIALAIYIFSLGFNFLKKYFNGHVDTKNDYLTKKKEEAYKVRLITDRKEFELAREKGELESIKEQNAIDEVSNQKEDERLKLLSDHLKKHETSVNNKDERITNWSKEIEAKELKLIEEQEQVDKEKKAQNERIIKLDAQESHLTQRLQEIEEQKINLEKYELPKLTSIVNASLHIKQFILDYKDKILNGEIIEAPRIPTTLQNFLTPKNMLINTGDNYLVVSPKGKDILKKLYDSLGK